MTNYVIWIKGILKLSAVTIESLNSFKLCGKARSVEFGKNEQKCPELIYYIYEYVE